MNILKIAMQFNNETSLKRCPARCCWNRNRSWDLKLFAVETRENSSADSWSESVTVQASGPVKVLY